MMNQRQNKILEAVIREYQKTGEPVASQILVKKYGFDLSPATIRSEMLALDKEDLLVQPHHSAGRVPTTKAYRLFVNQILDSRLSRVKDEKKIKKNLMRFEPERTFSYEVAQILAQFSHNLGLSGFFGREPDFHEAGLASLLKDEEMRRPESIFDILHGVDILEKEFNDLFAKLEDEVKIFIGEENPIDDFKECSLIVARCQFDDEDGFLGILGPKRMNYARNISLVEETKKALKKH